MKFLLFLFLIDLPGVARTSRLVIRQGPPSGNFSVILPPQSPSSQKEPVAPSLVATSSARTSIPSNIPKQGRGPEGPESATPPGTPTPPSEPTPGIVASVELPSPRESPVGPTVISPVTDVEINTDTAAFLFPSSSTIPTPAEVFSAQVTTIVTTTSFSVGESPPTTLFTSKTSPGVVASTPSEESGTIAITPNSGPSDSTASPTNTATMSDPTATPSSASPNGGGSGSSTLTIVLSTVLSVMGVALIALAAYLCTGSRRRRIPMLKRGITPIGDDEIATWKSNKPAEKETDRYTTRPSHSQNASISTSTRRAPSLIQYQNGGRPSLEVTSPRSFISSKYSFDLPQAPGAVLARAPNARSGLTDDMVPGDDPFLPSPRRQPSRLQKLPPNSPNMHSRTKESRSSSMRSFAEAAWRDAAAETSSPRSSGDRLHNHNRIYSSSSIPPPPRISFGGDDQLTGLSPPPSRRNDGTIGLAVG
ncbi:hypothetical protein AAE478_002248 [Parahypoxylon ruwenzoriense]